MTERLGPQDIPAVIRDLHEHIRRLEKQVDSDTLELMPLLKGDLKIGRYPDVWELLGVGTDAQVLMADSAQDLGVKWGNASSAAGDIDCTVDHDLTANNLATKEFKSFADAFANVTPVEGNLRIYLRSQQIGGTVTETTAIPTTVTNLYIRGRAETIVDQTNTAVELQMNGLAFTTTSSVNVVLDSCSLLVFTGTTLVRVRTTNCWLGTFNIGVGYLVGMGTRFGTMTCRLLHLVASVIQTTSNNSYDTAGPGYLTVIVANKWGGDGQNKTSTITFSGSGNILFANNASDAGPTGIVTVTASGGELIFTNNSGFAVYNLTTFRIHNNSTNDVTQNPVIAFVGNTAKSLTVTLTTSTDSSGEISSSVIVCADNVSERGHYFCRGFVVSFTGNNFYHDQSLNSWSSRVILHCTKTQSVQRSVGWATVFGTIVCVGNILQARAIKLATDNYIIDIGPLTTTEDSAARIICKGNILSWGTTALTSQTRGIRIRDGVARYIVDNNIIDAESGQEVVNASSGSGLLGPNVGAGGVIIGGADEALATHLADTTDAHDASAVSFVPAGTIAASQVQAAIEEVATEYASADSAHAAAADPHTGYQKESEKSAASGYASLDAGTKVPTAELGTGTADATTFLRGDQTYSAHEAYTPTNDTTDRSFDADTVTLPELADVVATLLRDLAAGKTPSV